MSAIVPESQEGWIFYTTDQETAFNTLKSTMTQALVLCLPYLTKPFIFEADAYGSGIGAILMQPSPQAPFLPAGRSFFSQSPPRSRFPSDLVENHPVFPGRTHRIDRKSGV